MHDGTAIPSAGIGHNSSGATIAVEVRLFNSVARFANGGGWRRTLALAPGATVSDVLARLAIPPGEVFLLMVNGRDVTPGVVGAPVRTARELDHGDVVALSGPVPFSWGYGTAVV